MKRQTLFSALVALGLLATSALAAENWTQIGAIAFDDPWQRTVIDISPKAGPMTAIRFDVKGADVEIDSFKVVYGNGQVDEIPVRSVFKGGTSSRRIDLIGKARNVRQINIVYRAHGKTRINVFGDAAAMQPQWAELGCQSVGFLVDKDTIRVGAQQGTFSALRLRVARKPVEFLDVTVVYGNGSSETLKVRSVIAAGTASRAIDLRGGGRNIKKIDLLYRSVPSFKDQAVVCADGLIAP